MIRHRRAQLAVSKKRPSLNLFGHGKTRKLGAERDEEEEDDDTFRYALLAAAGLAGAAGLVWAARNTDIVQRAQQFFGISVSEVQANGGDLPGDEPPPQGMAAQDAEALRIAQESGDDDGIVRFLTENARLMPAIGASFTFDFNAFDDPQQALTEYARVRGEHITSRTMALVQHVGGDGGGNPEDGLRAVADFLGVEGTAEMSPDQLMAEISRVTTSGSHAGFNEIQTEADTSFAAAQQSAQYQHQAREQRRYMEVLRQHYAGSDIPYRGTLPDVANASPEDQSRARFRSAALDHILRDPTQAESPYGDAFDALLADIDSQLTPDNRQTLYRVMAEERDAGRLPPMATRLMQQYGDERGAELAFFVDRINDRATQTPVSALDRIMARADANYLVTAVASMADPEIRNRYPVAAAALERLEIAGVDVTDPDSIREWASSAAPAEVRSITDDTALAGRQVLAVRDGFVQHEPGVTSPRVAGVGEGVSGSQVIDRARAADQQLRARFMPGETNLSMGPDLLDFPLTALAAPGFGWLAHGNMALTPMAQNYGQAQLDPADPTTQGTSMPMDRAQQQYYAAVVDRMQAEQAAIQAGDLGELERIRSQPLPELEGLQEIMQREQARTLQARGLNQGAWAASSRISAPLMSTRAMAGAGLPLMIGMSFGNPEVRAAFAQDPFGVSSQMAGNFTGALAANYGMRYTNPTGGAGSFRFQGLNRARWNPGRWWRPRYTGQNSPLGTLLGGGRWIADRAGARVATNVTQRLGYNAASNTWRQWAVNRFARWTGTAAGQAARAGTSARLMFSPRIWGRAARNLRTAITGGRATAGLGRAALLANRGRALLAGLGRGAVQYAQFNTLMAGGQALGDIGRTITDTLFGGTGAADEAYRKAYMGTVGMNGNVEANGGWFATVADLGDVPLFGDYSSAAMTAAATSGFRWARDRSTGSIAGDWIYSEDYRDENYQNMAAYQGYMAAMRDLGTAAVLEETQRVMRNDIEHLPFYAGASTELRANLDNALGMAALARSDVGNWESVSFLDHRDIAGLRQGVQAHYDSFRLNADVLADHNGMGFMDESLRFLEHMSGGDADIMGYMQALAVQNVMANTPGVDPMQLREGEMEDIFAAYIQQQGVQVFEGHSRFARAARQHEATYGGMRRQLEAVLGSSVNLRHLSDERREAIIDTALSTMAADYTRQVEEWRGMGATDEQILTGGTVINPDGEEVRVGVGAWRQAYTAGLGAGNMPTAVERLSGEAGAVESGLRDFLTAAVGEDPNGLLDWESIDAEIDQNSGLTFEQRNNVPGQGLYTTERSELDVETADAWRESMRLGGTSLYDAGEDPYFENTYLEEFRSGEGYDEAFETRQTQDWINDQGETGYGIEGGRQRESIDFQRLARQLAEDGNVQVRYDYGWDDLQRYNPRDLEYRTRESTLLDYADSFTMEYDPETGAPVLVAQANPNPTYAHRWNPDQPGQLEGLYGLRDDDEARTAAVGRNLDAARRYAMNLRALAAADPQAYAEATGMTVEQVLISLEEPRLRQQMAIPEAEGGGFRVFNEFGDEEVVRTWQEARHRLMRTAASPGAHPGMEFQPQDSYTWEGDRTWGQWWDPEAHQDELRAAHRRRYEADLAAWNERATNRATDFNRYERYFSPEMQQYRRGLAQWHHNREAYRQQEGYYTGGPSPWDALWDAARADSTPRLTDPGRTPGLRLGSASAYRPVYQATTPQPTAPVVSTPPGASQPPVQPQTGGTGVAPVSAGAS